MILTKASYKIETPIDFDMLKRIENCGRTCYKSEAKHSEQVDKLLLDEEFCKKFSTVDIVQEAEKEITRRFVRMILKSGHESVVEHQGFTVRFVCDRGCCYSDDTLVLTENGWKLFQDIVEHEKVYTLNEENELILIEPIKKLEYDYTGNMYRFATTQVDMFVTPNHNMWVYDYNKRSINTRKWKFLKAEQMFNARYEFYKSCDKNIIYSDIETISIDGCTRSTKYFKALHLDANLFLELVGFWVTDGSLDTGSKISGRKIIISQTKEKNRYRIEWLLQQLNLHYIKNKKNFVISSPPIYLWLENHFIDKTINNKKTYYLNIPRDIMNLGQNNLKYFLNGIVAGDGSATKDGRILITTVSEEFAKNLVEIFLKTNSCANYYPTGKIGREHTDPKGRIFKSKVQAYTVSAIRNKITLLKTKTQKTIENYSGKVYCLELPEHHKLYVMRNGKACWSGNSHELVRQRLCSFSQESTRYCNYSKKDHCEFIIPCWTNLKSGIYERISPEEYNQEETIWLFSCINAQNNYFKLLKAGWKPEQARSVLPNSLKTEIVVTANMREWRTVFKQRTSSKAHPQMRELMIPLLNELKQSEIGVLFEDINNE